MKHGEEYRLISDRVSLREDLTDAVPDLVEREGRLEWDGLNLRYVSRGVDLDMGEIQSLTLEGSRFKGSLFARRAGGIAAVFLVGILLLLRLESVSSYLLSIPLSIAAGGVLAGLFELQRLLGNKWVRVDFKKQSGQSGAVYLFDRKGNWTGGGKWLFGALVKLQKGEDRERWPKDWNWLADSIYLTIGGAGSVILSILLFKKGMSVGQQAWLSVFAGILGVFGLALLAGAAYTVLKRNHGGNTGLRHRRH